MNPRHENLGCYLSQDDSTRFQRHTRRVCNSVLNVLNDEPDVKLKLSKVQVITRHDFDGTNEVSLMYDLRNFGRDGADYDVFWVKLYDVLVRTYIYVDDGHAYRLKAIGYPQRFPDRFCRRIIITYQTRL